jgi:hypothetical protein
VPFEGIYRVWGWVPDQWMYQVNTMFPVHIIAVNILNKCLPQGGGIFVHVMKVFSEEQHSYEASVNSSFV